MKKLAIVGLLTLLAGPAGADGWLDINGDRATGEINGQHFSGTYSETSGALEGDIGPIPGDRFSGHYDRSTGKVSGEVRSQRDDDGD
jgi:hypothetical protein